MMCNKMTFPTSEEARKHLKTIFSRRSNKGKLIKKLYVYRCNICDNYHLTSKSKAEQKRIKKGINMSNIIQFPSNDERVGYITNGTEVIGVYVDNIAAMTDNGNVYIGSKGEDEINNATLTNIKDLNEFCLMWLLIFDSKVIKDEL